MLTQLSVTPPVPVELVQVTLASSHKMMSSSLIPPDNEESVTLIDPMTSIGPVLVICAPFSVHVPEQVIPAPNIEPVTIRVPCTSMLQALFLSGITRDVPSPDSSSASNITGVVPCADSVIVLIEEIWKGCVVMLTVTFSTSKSPFQSN